MTREERQVQRLKERLYRLGPFLPGSISKQYNVCGNPSCKCKDPRNPRRHGPYYQLSWKEAGKTVSRRLSPEHARLYQQWVANRRDLESLLQQMRAVSRQAGRYLLDAAESLPNPKSETT